MDDADKPALSQDTLRALNEFLSEAKAAADEQQHPFSENWGLSQVPCFVLSLCSDVKSHNQHANIPYHKGVRSVTLVLASSTPSTTYWLYHPWMDSSLSLHEHSVVYYG